MKTQLATFTALAAQFQTVNIKTLLWLRKTKTNKAGTAPIMLRVFTSVNERFERSTGIRATPEEWDAPNGRILGKSKAVQKQNEQLQLMRAHIPELINLMKAVGKKVTLSSLRRELSAPEVGKSPCYIDLVQRMNSLYKENNPARHERARTAIVQLIAWNGLLAKDTPRALPIDEFTPRRAAEFYDWMLTVRGLKTASANSNIKWLTHLFKQAAEFDEVDIGDNPFRALRRKKAELPPPRLHLSREQLATLRDAELPLPQGLARDVYMTQYYLHGSRIGSVVMLRWSQVEPTQVRFKAEKGGPYKVVAISPELARILDRYRSTQVNPTGFVFPYLPAQFDKLPLATQHVKRHSAKRRVNSNLKKVAALLGIEGNLHSHTARHTLAGHAAELGGLDVAQAMLGHANQAQTAHYAGPLHNEGLAQVERALYGGETMPPPAPEPTSPTPNEGGKVLPLWKGGEAA